MQEPRLIETREVRLADIDRRQRLRPVADASVTSLIASIQELGLQNEIHLRQLPDGKLVLMAGGHRCAAYEQMQRETIPSKIWEVCDDAAALFEIDDNLAHAELSPLEKAVFLAHRKVVYERAHPETKAATGAELAKKRWDASDSPSVASFATATAEKMGVSERTIFRILAAGERLDGQDIQHLRNAPSQITFADLEEIAKCTEPSTRYAICQKLGAGEAKTAKEAARVISNGSPTAAAPVDPAEAHLKKLLDAWSRAPQAARRRFVAERYNDLAALQALGGSNDE